jgi:hypothetical protein
VNAFPSVPPIAFAGDWRRPYMDAIKRAFPRLDQGGIRDTLARAIGRARDPGAAATSLSDVADGLKLTGDDRNAVTLLVGSLAKQSSFESEI